MNDDTKYPANWITQQLQYAIYNLRYETLNDLPTGIAGSGESWPDSKESKGQLSVT